MASLQKTYSGDLTESIALQLMSIVGDARGMASDAKKNAMDVAKAYGVDPMLRRGEFFGRALQTRATAGLPKIFQRQMPSVTMGDPSYLARGQVGNDPLMGTPAHLRNLPEYQQFASPAERKFRGTAANTQALTEAAGQKPTTNPITKSKGVKVEDEKLGSFIAAVALSLNSSIKSINEKMGETSKGVIAAKEGIANTLKKLEDNGDTVSDKLDKIIDALRFQNQLTKKNADRREVSTKEIQEDKRKQVSDANRIQKSDMTRGEVRDQQQLDIFEQDGVIRNDTPMIPDPWDTPPGEGMPFGGSFERGGIASGPDSGYLAVLHGDEAIVPLDNNHTQGQPSAIANESVGDMPMLPRAESGMSAGGIKPGDNSPSTMPRMRRGGGNKSSSSMFGGDKLAKAMELPAKAAGMVTMGLLGNVLKSVPLIGSVVSGIKLLSEPVAKMFGVPDQVGSSIAGDVANQQKQEAGRKAFTSRSRGKEGREKGILSKIKEFFFGEGGGTRVAHSSRVVHKGGTGGYGTGGGTRIAWGKKAFNPSSKSEVPAIKRRTMTTDEYSVEADMLSPEAFEKKWNMPYETWRQLPMYPTDQSSNFFQTSASPMTAFNSPETNNTFATHINNESINDEVSQIINAGKVEPIIVNQNSGSSDNIDESPHSAIANSASPFKEWMYTEPYA